MSRWFGVGFGFGFGRVGSGLWQPLLLPIDGAYFELYFDGDLDEEQWASAFRILACVEGSGDDTPRAGIG